MPALDPSISMRCLEIEREQRLMKQAPSHMHPNFSTRVEVEMDKLVTVASYGRYSILSG